MLNARFDESRRPQRGDGRRDGPEFHRRKVSVDGHEANTAHALVLTRLRNEPDPQPGARERHDLAFGLQPLGDVELDARARTSSDDEVVKGWLRCPIEGQEGTPR